MKTIAITCRRCKINGRPWWYTGILNVGSLLRGHQRLSAILSALKPIRKRDICMAVQVPVVMRKPLRNKSGDLAGKTFGRLTVMEFAGFANRGGIDYSAWKCRCECGTIDVFSVSSFSKKNACCGCCKNGVRLSAQAKDVRTLWRGMLARCYKPNTRGYKNYGGRGIRVCERWRNSLEAFAEDIGPRPSATHTLDRRDNEGDYEPGNCRWATAVQQMSNTRKSRYITFQGITLTHSGWAKACGKTREAFQWMARKHGDIQALERYDINWVKVAELSAKCAIPSSAISH